MKKFILIVLLLGISLGFGLGYVYANYINVWEMILPSKKPIVVETKQLPKEITKDQQYYFLVEKKNHLLHVINNNQVIKTYQVAVGKNTGNKTKEGDLKTPEGKYFVDEIINASSWTHDFKDGKGEIAGAYGPYFISLKTEWDGIGIHGTHDPSSIGTNVSEGCIRMHNAQLLELKNNYVTVNTMVIIKE